MQKEKMCKESKIILLVSLVISLILLIAGIVTGVNGDKGGSGSKSSGKALVAESDVRSISLNSNTSVYDSEEMFVYRATSDERMKITVNCTGNGCTLYVMDENSKKEFERGNYSVSHCSGGETSYQFPVKDGSEYYFYIVSNSSSSYSSSSSSITILLERD